MKKISTFPERLHQYMADNNKMTYEKLSEFTGFPAQTLNRYALGQRIPKIDDFERLAKRMGVNPLWLQGFDEPMYDIDPYDVPLTVSRETLDVAQAYENAPLRERNLIRMILDLPLLTPIEEEPSKKEAI